MEWRFFKEDDLEWILKATKDMFDESEWNDGEYDKEKIKSVCDTIGKRKNGCSFYDEKIYGMG